MKLSIHSDDYNVFVIDEETGNRVLELCQGQIDDKESCAINFIAAMEMLESVSPTFKNERIQSVINRVYPQTTLAAEVAAWPKG